MVGEADDLTVERTDTVPDDWDDILALAKQHRATLGFLTDSAFEDRVRLGHFVVARNRGRLAGYCLYDVPRAGYIKLVHVCVATRGMNIGKRMIEKVIESHREATGVVAYCRRDYGLDGFWSSVGLAPRGEKPGRARGGSTLTRWWMPLGDLDLFEDAAFGAGRPLVAYDTNVISDLYGSLTLDRGDREESQGLLAPWLDAEITPVISVQVDVEIERIDDGSERERQRQGYSHMVRLRNARSSSTETYDALLARAGTERLDADQSLRDDLCHVADALDTGVSFLVTNDANLLSLASDLLPKGSALRLVRPYELIQEIDVQLGQPAFQSRLIEAVDLTWTSASDYPLDQLATIFRTEEVGERGNVLKKAIKAAIANNPRGTQVLTTTDGTPWALLAQRATDGRLQVPLLRVARRKETNTVALQLARHTRHIARSKNLHGVQVTDRALAAVVRDALVADGFDNDLVAPLFDQAVPAQRFRREHPEWELTTTGHLRDIERRYWPLVLLDAGAPTYLAPIQPRFMYPLFGAERHALFVTERSRALGLSREHVYFSGADKALPSRGARIIWYASSDDTETVRKIVATSRCLGVERLHPKNAFKLYSQVGVLSWKHVDGATDKTGRVTVVRFEDTELLNYRIGGEELRSLLHKHNVNQPIRSFKQVPPGLFDDLIRHQKETIE